MPVDHELPCAIQIPDVHSQDFDSARAELLIETVEQWQLMPADAARGRPEDQQHGPAAICAQIHAPTIRLIEREIRSRAPNRTIPLEKDQRRNRHDASQPHAAFALHPFVVTQSADSSLYT